ncbi:hypothetical protein D4764_01G0015180 [Takifugu flavidus]|uniref:Uncharacterized protein n=1 Tax=Takifugu flavidus TaxID=433684 RepID=A0A5C6PQE7_9TELE|nr:hypothetical protein D4764_01G0015180 [Takifugu flavidus]
MRAALQGCGAHEGHEGSPPGLRSTRGTRGQPSRTAEGAENGGGPPGDTKLERQLLDRNTSHGAGNRGGPPGDMKLERPSRRHKAGAALQETQNTSTRRGRQTDSLETNRHVDKTNRTPSQDKQTPWH